MGLKENAAYEVNDLVECCKMTPEKVLILKKPLKDAKADFNLNTMKDVIAFIANHGLEELSFVNSKLWENNPNKESPLFVDAYEFKSMFKLGYIAFMYNSGTDTWIVKSFHLSENHNPVMELALLKAKLIGDKK
jgi:hypothetical protein